MSEESGLAQRFGRGRQWVSRTSRGVLTGSRTVAEESDRWFLGALRGIEYGVAQAEGKVDTLANALVTQLRRIRPRWMRRRTTRERIEAMLRAEGKRQGFDVTKEEFEEFSRKMAILLELVYAGALPLDDIAFESAGEEMDTSSDAPTDQSVIPAPEPTSASVDR
jgi:hypothetical protein